MPQNDIRRGFSRGVDEAQRRANQGVQDNVPSHVRNGVMIQGVFVASGTNKTIQHKLGRQLSGWHALRPRGTGQVSEVSSNDKTLTLTASADVTVDVWVY